MKWHKESVRDNPDVMVHPANIDAWKPIDAFDSSFASESRNVYIGLTTYGFSSFNLTVRRTYAALMSDGGHAGRQIFYYGAHLVMLWSLAVLIDDGPLQPSDIINFWISPSEIALFFTSYNLRTSIVEHKTKAIENNLFSTVQILFLTV